MKKIILTGFLPFGNYKFNPTEESTRYYNSRSVDFETEIIGIVLPCTYLGAFQILSKIIDKEKPYAVISTGLSSSVKGVRIETVFRDIMNGKYPDANGWDPQHKIVGDKEGSWEFLAPNSNSTFLASLLYQNQIPVEVSSDAEGFICNSLAYLTTKKILHENLKIRNMFIHIPWTDDYRFKVSLEDGKIFLKKKDFYNAIELLIRNI